MFKRTGILSAIAVAALAAGSLPAGAWEQLDLGTAPSGQPTYAPQGQLSFENLPGVQLNRGQPAADGDCTQGRFNADTRPGFGNSGTLTECNFGRFSLKTYRSDGGSGGGYNPFPVPGPLQQGGPPPGSGGFAPRERW
jgi:hypothetical protein